MTTMVTGAGGFIGGHLVRRLIDEGREVLAVDRKKKDCWYQVSPRAANVCIDLREEAMVRAAVSGGVDEIYHLAADMGGIGFIENNRVSCMRSILMTLHLLEAAALIGVKSFFFSSSACVYNTTLQTGGMVYLSEGDAYPAMAERGYGWEKLYAEMLCQEYAAERDLPTFIARFHNIYGPHGTWRGGREKAPAALARKVAEAYASGEETIDVWGDGLQRRTYTYIDDCIEGVRRLVSTESMVGVPVNIGSAEALTVDQMIDEIEGVAAELDPSRKGRKLTRLYDTSAPMGVSSRAPNNRLIKERLGWEPLTSFRDGMRATYSWIEEQVSAARGGQKVID